MNAFVYYGLSLNTNDLGGNPFINFLIAGAVEFPAYYLTMKVIEKYGRRLSLVSFMIIGGCACLCSVPTFFISGKILV